MTDWFFRKLEDFRGQTALVWREQEYGYAQLLADVAEWRQKLAECSVAPGDCVVIAGDYSRQTCSLLLALIANRNIVVPLAPGEANQREPLLEVAQAQAIFEFPGDSPDQWSFTRRDASTNHELLLQLRQNGSGGLILFTSGSTGNQKAIVLCAERFLSKFQASRASYRTLVFLKLDHIGGLNTLFHVLGSGGTVVSSDHRTPEAIARCIETYGVQLLPTTPTFLNMLLISEIYKHYDLSSLQLITYGTEPMPASALAKLHEVLPHVRLKQTYGLSEVGILPSSSQDSASLWMKLGGDGYETKVVDGVLWIRTPSAMLGYLNAPSPFDADGWFNTGDAVEVEGEYVRILGRQSELINVGGEKVFPAEVESVIREMDNVLDVTVSGQRNPVTGSIVVARVTLQHAEPRSDFEARLRQFCRGRLAEYKIPVLVHLTDSAQHTVRFKKQRVPVASENAAEEST